MAYNVGDHGDSLPLDMDRYGNDLRFVRAPTQEKVVTQDTQTAFFSYCRQDSDFALRLAEDLKAAGASVWLDQLNILPGQRWDRAVEEALTNCRRMVVILSPAAVSSTNVMDEVSFALEEQKTVIPVIYRDCTVPFRLRRVQYVDFRQDYARGLQVLLKILAPGQSVGQSKPAIADVGIKSPSEVPDEDEFDEQARLGDEHRKAAEQARLEEERRQAAERARVEEEHKRAEEARIEDERRKAAERARLEEEREQAAEQAGVEEERRRVAEGASLEDEGRNAEAEAERTTPGSQPTEQTTLTKFLKIGALAILASLLFFVAVIVWDLLKFG